MPSSLKTSLIPSVLLVAFVSFAGSPATRAQSANLQYQVANLMEDVRLLDERIRQMSIQMDELRRDNQNLRQMVRDYEAQSDQSLSRFASVGQLNEAIRQAVSKLETRDDVVKKEVLAEVSKTMAEFAKRVEKALSSVPAMERPDPTVKTRFDKTGIPTSGVPYVVQPGDSISSIAKKFNSRPDWIQNANEISDPRLLQVGQAIFVPQRQD